MSLDATRYYDCNLQALRVRQPDVAARIDACELPNGSEASTARDGTNSATFLNNAGQRVWLGRSSMPRVSTEAQLDGAAFGPGNVSTPGILTGVETLALLARLEPQFAVFVIEKNLERVKLALHVHDYASAIDSGRLVLIPQDQLERTFLTFFTAHPGYEFPQHLLTAIQRTPIEIADLRQQLEASAGGVAACQRDAARAISDDFNHAGEAGLASGPRIAIMTLETNPDVQYLAAKLSSAAQRIGWTATHCVPDTPEKCHMVARLRAATDLQANLVLFLGGGAAALRTVLPESLPIASWFWPTSTIHTGVPPATGAHDIVFAATQLVRDRLAAVGVCQVPIHDLPVGATTAAPPRDENQPETNQPGERLRVIVLGDLPPTEPQACGIGLRSHMTLWNALLRTAMNDTKHHRVLDLDSLLERVQHDTGTSLDGAGLAARIRDAALEHIIPVAETAGLLDALRSADCDVSLYGRGLGELAADDEYHGAIPPLAELDQTLHEADAVLLPVADARTSIWSVNALASATGVLCRSSGAFHAACSDALTPVLRAIQWVSNAAELNAIVSEICADLPAYRAALSGAAPEVTDNHGIAARLQFIYRLAIDTTEKTEAQTHSGKPIRAPSV